MFATLVSPCCVFLGHDSPAATPFQDLMSEIYRTAYKLRRA